MRSFPSLHPTNGSPLRPHLEEWKRGALVATYDVRLASTLADFDSGRPPPPLWNEFDGLARVPVLVIRGATSDILSESTVSAMRARHPDLECIEVPDQGHVPLLEGAMLLQRIAAFVGKCERSAPSQGGTPPS